MGGMTRREWVLSAAATAAAFGLTGRMAVSAPVQPPERRQQTPEPKPGIHRYKVGAAECIALYDGVWEKVHDPAFFQNASVEETKQALAAAGLRSDFVPIPIVALVVKINGKLVLCDAGGGGQVQAFNPNSVFVSGKLFANLRAAEIDPAKIETILISHFHPDHIFGLLGRKTNKPVFPNAEIIVPAAEYKWWTDPSLIGRLPKARQPLARRIQSVIPKWKNVLPVDGEDEVVPGIRFVKAPGHTAGHTVFHLTSGKDQLLISNDTAYVPALVAEHPGWHGAYDQDAAMAEQTRRKLLEWTVGSDMMICGTHFPWPGVGRISRDGAGYAFNL
ncbi:MULTISPECIES: MBL fold metallo-hydrolase [Rhodomicrobium]|uniref:MBL fold metallo-hydrolase n=1 Tax=Rhodomicrobium TaxID=1068 RepID=UPI000B4B331C|nr:MULTISPECIES: MBL fold metallo-hydrolase [Rhodomicrobium]